MNVENLFHYRHGMRLESQQGEIQTTWDKESLEKAIFLLWPLFEEAHPLAVFARLGVETEVEEEDLFGEDIGRLDTLHMEIFLAEGSKDVHSKFYSIEQQ